METGEIIQDRIEYWKDLYFKEKKKNEELYYKIDEKDLIINGMKENRRIAIEELREEYL